MTENETIAVRATVAGRVQGVGYRDAVRRRARELGALGWVRNEDDGTVRVHAEGPRDAVEALVGFLKEGPPGAAVESVASSPGRSPRAMSSSRSAASRRDASRSSNGRRRVAASSCGSRSTARCAAGRSRKSRRWSHR